MFYSVGPSKRFSCRVMPACDVLFEMTGNAYFDKMVAELIVAKAQVFCMKPASVEALKVLLSIIAGQCSWKSVPSSTKLQDSGRNLSSQRVDENFAHFPGGKWNLCMLFCL